MPRPRLSNEERALRELREKREKLTAEAASISEYAGAFWRDYRAQVEESLVGVDTAIRNVEANGVPEGWAEKWSPEPVKTRRRR